MAIVSLSGATLAGWFVAGDGRGGVLLLHGAKSTRLTHVERMRTLHNAGYSTLAIDFQAHGESAGNRITLGQREALDARSALEWMRARMPGEGLAALGVSMGGAAALIGGPIRTDALIVESVFPDLAPSLSKRLALEIGEAARAATPILLLALRVSSFWLCASPPASIVGGYDRSRQSVAFTRRSWCLRARRTSKRQGKKAERFSREPTRPNSTGKRPAQGTSISLTPAAKPTGSACSDFWLRLCALVAFPRGDCRPIVERAA